MLAFIAIVACFGAGAGAKPVLWMDPSKIEAVDFSDAHVGPELAPKPPFQFVREDDHGTSPKVTVRDASGAEWRVKGGLEARPETFVTRLIRALGYYTETMFFRANGRIEGVGRLNRASGFIKPDGSFTYASFERVDPDVRFIDGENWAYNSSPFKGSPQIQGLKILIMLVSNWDNKDGRDSREGSNTAVLGCANSASEMRIHLVTDWGQTMGRWGSGGILGRQNVWDCKSYSEQTNSFVTRVEGQYVRFGYIGQHTHDFKHDITVDDVRWLMRYLGRITDAQVRAGLRASGATRDEEECFSKALRDRIEQLRRAAIGRPLSRYSK